MICSDWKKTSDATGVFLLFTKFSLIYTEVWHRTCIIDMWRETKGVRQMIGVIVGTHGKFSEEILRSTEMVFGQLDNVAGVTFEPGESVSGLVEKYKAALASLDWTDGVIFLVDLFGGSPYNAASRIAVNHEKMDIVTGVNLPMIVDLLANRGIEQVENLVNLAIHAGHDSMMSFRAIRNSQLEEEL